MSRDITNVVTVGVARRRVTAATHRGRHASTMRHGRCALAMRRVCAEDALTGPALDTVSEMRRKRCALAMPHGPLHAAMRYGRCALAMPSVDEAVSRAVEDAGVARDSRHR